MRIARCRQGTNTLANSMGFYACLMFFALGEILVDSVSTAPGAELDRASSFTKAAGGAPANTAVGLARQGVSTGFVGRVSDDGFGRWLKDVLECDGIDTSGTIVDPQAQTRMAYVVTTITGDRKLAEFSKIACADARLHPRRPEPGALRAIHGFALRLNFSHC